MSLIIQSQTINGGYIEYVVGEKRKVEIRKNKIIINILKENYEKSENDYLKILNKKLKEVFDSLNISSMEELDDLLLNKKMSLSSDDLELYEFLIRKYLFLIREKRKNNDFSKIKIDSKNFKILSEKLNQFKNNIEFYKILEIKKIIDLANLQNGNKNNEEKNNEEKNNLKINNDILNKLSKIINYYEENIDLISNAEQYLKIKIELLMLAINELMKLMS